MKNITLVFFIFIVFLFFIRFEIKKDITGGNHPPHRLPLLPFISSTSPTEEQTGLSPTPFDTVSVNSVEKDTWVNKNSREGIEVRLNFLRAWR